MTEAGRATDGPAARAVEGVVWTPRADDLERSHVARLMRRHGVGDVRELRRRAATDADWFYPALFDDLGVEWQRPYDRLVDRSRGLPWTQWFVGGRLNLVHNVLDRHLRDGHGDLIAVVAEDDDERVERLTYAELGSRVGRLAAVLVADGVGAGEAVGFSMPMSADTVVALLACLKIGAVPVPVFAGFGPEALAARLVDAGARVVLTADGTRRRGRSIPLKPTVDAACASAAGVERVLVLRRTGEEVAWDAARDRWWHEAVDGAGPPPPTAELDASSRALLLYTSGTTGRPKGTVHTHGGVQTVTAKESAYHFDVRPADVVFWLTDIGWMMGPWTILGTLFHRGTVVLLDGPPDHPDAGRVWRMVERHRITHLAMAPTAVRVLAAAADGAPSGHDLSSVRMLGSTGEPWDDASYRWFSEHAGGGRCPIVNISGGTELMGCLLAPLPVAPLKPSTLQGPALGMDVDVVDEEGRPVRGRVGHLVCRDAAPNMTRGFLGAPERYLDAYFSDFGTELWSHGDWATIDGDGYWFLTGRADDTLKIAGKRVGPGEVEAAAVAHRAVREAAAVGLDDPLKGTRLVLVAVPVTAGERPGDEVIRHVADALGGTMRPSEIVWTEALPVTRSGKIVRGTIRAALAGEDSGSLASVANPEAVERLRRSPDGRDGS